MARRKTIENLRRDREELVIALRDFKAGGAEHLTDAERASTIISLERRIAMLDAQLEGATDA